MTTKGYITNSGFECGNGFAKVCLARQPGEKPRVAKVVAAYSLKRPPGLINSKSGLENDPRAFALWVDGDALWFGSDVLGGQVIRELDENKYNPDHIALLFRAALYQWGKQHKVDLADLGKLNVVCSMPPGSYKDRGLNRKASLAYQRAFNRRQSHLKIKDERGAVQVITQYGGLAREAVGYMTGATAADLTLTVDIGYGTVIYVLFNGRPEPIQMKTDNSGLLHAYLEINGVAPNLAELNVLREKGNLPDEVKMHFNAIKNRVQSFKRAYVDHTLRKITFIGGGASLMTARIKASFRQMAPEVVFKDEYVNVRSNWALAEGQHAD